MMKGLIRVLYEQEVIPFYGETDCCDKETGQFISNNGDGPIEWTDLRIYRTVQELQDDQAKMTNNDFTALTGPTVEEFHQVLSTDSDLCKLHNLLLQVDEDNELKELAKTSLIRKIKDLCPEAVVTQPVITNDLCSKPVDGKSWYLFDYNGKLSPQVRNEFKDEILNKVGITGGLFAPGEEVNCIEEVKVWYEAPDKHITSKAYTNFAAPALNWWDGFKLDCNCGRKTEDTYMNGPNLKITDLKHPYANPTKLITPTKEKTSNTTIKKSTTNNSKVGLETIITKDQDDNRSSYNIDFL